MTQTPTPARPDIEDVGVLEPRFRKYAHPATWAWDTDAEQVALDCDSCEVAREVDHLEAFYATDGDTCPECTSCATRRVIVAWTPKAWLRPVVRP